MSKTSTAVKDRWNKNNYDSYLLRVKKGDKQVYKEYAASQSKSLNQLIIDLINSDIANNKDTL